MRKITIILLVLCSISMAPALIAQDSDLEGEFELTTHLNEHYSSSSAKGKVILLFFGFTLCPDICPNTLSTIQTVMQQLEDKANLVQPLFITVDPKRDTPGVLNAYLQYFDSNIIGLTGSHEEIDKVVNQFKGFYSYAGDVSSDQYMVDHTSNLYILDTQGKVTNIMPFGLPPQAITIAVEKILMEQVVSDKNSS